MPDKFRTRLASAVEADAQTQNRPCPRSDLARLAGKLDGEPAIVTCSDRCKLSQVAWRPGLDSGAFPSKPWMAALQSRRPEHAFRLSAGPSAVFPLVVRSEADELGVAAGGSRDQVFKPEP